MEKFLCVFAFWLLSICLVYSQSPTIASVSEVQGTVDTRIGISGSNFSTNSAELAVWFGSMKGNIIQSTDNFIEVEVPSGASTSSIAVTNTATGLTGYSSAIFNLNFSGVPGPLDVAGLEISHFDSFEEIFDLTICDFDLDGLNDIATSKIGETSGDIAVFQNTSSGNVISFTLLNKLTNLEFDIKNPTSNVTHGDVDGDGKPDLIATRSVPTANQIYVWRNISTTGNIKFASQKSYFIHTGDIAKTIKVRDIDGDGKTEIIVASNEVNEFHIIQNTSTKGNINFSSTPIVFEISGATSTNGLDVEDIDDDGKADIVVNPLFEPNVFILKNLSTKGNFIFDTPVTLNLSGNLNSLVVGDLNRDGLKDIVVTKTQESKIAFFLNSSGSEIQFSNAVEFDSGTRPWGLDLGDIDGDGLLDLITTSINSTDATYFHNTSAGTTLDFDIVSISMGFNSRNTKIADLSGDGKSDVALTSFDFTNDEFRLSTIRITHCFAATILDAPESICNGQTIRINATPGLFTNYVWRKDGVEVKNSSDPFLDITGNGTYNVTAVSEGTTCSATSSDFSVSLGSGGIPPDIANTVLNDGPACPGETINLSIQEVSGATYEWKGPEDFTSTSQNPVLSDVTPEMAGIYEAIVFLGDCQSFPATTLVEVIFPPDFSIQADGPTRFCEGGSVVLSTNSETGYTYQWFKDNTEITGETSTSFTANEPGDYTVEVSSTSVSCSIDTEIIGVSTFSPPDVQFTFSGIQCATNDIQFTDGSTVLSEFASNYQWDFGDGTTSTDTNPVHSFATAGDYTVELTISYDGQNCTSSTSNTVSISEPTPFTITVTGDVPFCQGESAVLSVGGTFDTYEWSSGETTSEITVTSAGTYSVSATNPSGCVSSDEVDITVFDVPVITIIPDSVAIQQGESVPLEASGALTYIWSPAETLSDSTISNPEATPLVTTTYTVVGTDINGCTGQAEVTINVDTDSKTLPVVAPKLFSPNGDTIDDEWVIENLENFPECQIVIFSRAGTTVFEAQPYNNDWDGIFNGGPLPEGAYYYVISCPDGRKNSGSISIIR